MHNQENARHLATAIHNAYTNALGPRKRTDRRVRSLQTRTAAGDAYARGVEARNVGKPCGCPECSRAVVK